MRMILVAIVIAMGVGGCSTEKEDIDSGQGAITAIGVGGGRVTGPNGAALEIPAGALSEDVKFSISLASAGFQTLPALAMGPVYAIEPHGTTFSKPATLSLPFTGQAAEVAVYTSEPGQNWKKLATDAAESQSRVEVTHLSFFFNGREVCGLMRQECCDGQCAGDALVCVDGRCLGCGFAGEPCCNGKCYSPMETCEGVGATGTGNYVCNGGRCKWDCTPSDGTAPGLGGA